jgi:hypothetical protein
VSSHTSLSLKGAEVNGLLSPGRIYAKGLYTFDFKLPEVSEKDESIVFHEERYIRMLLHNQGLPLKNLSPGTFLDTGNQQWMISTEWDGLFLKWSAQSVSSGLFFRGDNQVIELSHGQGAKEECERLLNIISSQIPPAQIVEYNILEEMILSGLRNLGYSDSSPKCELRIIEKSERLCRYGVFHADGFQRDPFLSHIIEIKGPVHIDVFLEEISTGLIEGEMSAYNISNTNAFLEKISDWVSEYVTDPISELDEPEQ